MEKRVWIGFLSENNPKSKTCPEPFDSAQDKLRRRIQNLKWGGIVAIGVTFGLCGALAHAQQPTKIPQIGYLTAGSASPNLTGTEAFRRGLRELGYIEGKSFVIEYRSAGDKLDRLPALADELVRLKVDLLLTVATPAAVAAKNVTRTIPIVFVGGFDPVVLGLVDSLARPGGNVTGVTGIAPVLAGKRLELLKEIVPKLSRVAILWDSQNQGSTQQWTESQLPARELGLQLHSMEVSSADKYEGAFKEATKARSDALAVAGSQLSIANQKRIANLAAKHRLPSIYNRGDYVASGGLMSYGVGQAEPFRRAAIYVDKILKGAKPADLPVEQPTKFELIINLKTAKALGLKIPQSILLRVDEVIE